MQLLHGYRSVREMSGERQSSESLKRMRASPPSPISTSGTKPAHHGGSLGTGGGLAGYGAAGGGPRASQLPAPGTSSTAAVARYVDDDINFLRDLREINLVERDQMDRDTPIDARIHSTISNGTCVSQDTVIDVNLIMQRFPNFFDYGPLFSSVIVGGPPQLLQ